jgi:predicted RNase H-like HicB family nuclease
MERVIRLTVEFLPEQVYLAVSEDPQGLLVQAATMAEVLEIADDIARILIEGEGGDATIPRRFEIDEIPYVAAA